MKLFCGTSGFSYKEWKGPFYPEKLPAARMLEYYAERLPTVEVNNTFYRLPKGDVMAGWRERVPDGFRFVVKASQRITHRARLKDTDETVVYLWSAVTRLGDRLGPLLFQLPPNFKADVGRLEAFLASLPDECRPVLEFRHASWRDPATAAALATRAAATCVTDSDDEPEPPIPETADWGYLRLRRSRYTDADLDRWVERIRSTGWSEVWVFFKHEDQGAAPALALDFARRFEEA